MKIMRVFKKQKYVELFLTKVNISDTVTSFFSNLIKILFQVHIVGCAWAIFSKVEELDERDTWIRGRGI